MAPPIIGKPQPDLIQMILEILGSDPDMIFMLTDQIETDIIAGQAAAEDNFGARRLSPREVPEVTP